MSQARWTTASTPRKREVRSEYLTSAWAHSTFGSSSSGRRRARPSIDSTASSSTSDRSRLVPTLPVAPTTTTRMTQLLDSLNELGGGAAWRGALAQASSLSPASSCLPVSSPSSASGSSPLCHSSDDSCWDCSSLSISSPRFVNTARALPRQRAIQAVFPPQPIWAENLPPNPSQEQEMSKTARDVMTPECKCVTETDTVLDAAKRL